MEPLSTAFATIVALIGAFSAERRGAASANFDEFVEFLVRSNHSELVDLIRRSDATVVGIKALLSVQREELIARLQDLDEAIAHLASGFDTFRGVATAIYPDSELSHQASTILEKFVDSGASKLLGIPYLDEGMVLQFMDGNGSRLTYTEPKFVDDDLNTLVHLRLLRVELNGAGNPIYSITRAADRYVQARRNGA